jgi:hypothetical protein
MFPQIMSDHFRHRLEGVAGIVRCGRCRTTNGTQAKEQTTDWAEHSTLGPEDGRPVPGDRPHFVHSGDQGDSSGFDRLPRLPFRDTLIIFIRIPINIPQHTSNLVLIVSLTSSASASPSSP